MLQEQLIAYLQHKMPQAEGLAVSNVGRVPGGASRETWSFDAAWRESGVEVSRAFVVRRDPTASLLETERDVEFRVYQTLEGTGIPVPQVYWLGADPQWPGRSGRRSAASRPRSWPASTTPTGAPWASTSWGCHPAPPTAPSSRSTGGRPYSRRTPSSRSRA